MPYHKKMLIMLDKMELKHKANYYVINVKLFKSLCTRFSVTHVPTVLIFNDKELKRIVGYVLTSAFSSAFLTTFSEINSTMKGLAQ
jgi:hypothetical protein